MRTCSEVTWSNLVNSWGPGDGIWRHISGSTLAQVMAYCLTAPSHYLNQSWLITQESIYNKYLSHQFLKWAWNALTKIPFKSPRGQWVNSQFGYISKPPDIPINFLQWYPKKMLHGSPMRWGVFCFIHDRPWISPWIKMISNELDIIIHVIASQLSYCEVTIPHNP